MWSTSTKSHSFFLFKRFESTTTIERHFQNEQSYLNYGLIPHGLFVPTYLPTYIEGHFRTTT